MVEISKVERLAEIKAIMKGLEAEAKGLQQEIIEEGAPDKIKTSHGTLSLASRTTYECPDNRRMFEELEADDFIEVATVSYSAVKKRLGEVFAEELLGKKFFNIKSVSQYYTLRK